MVRLSSFKLFIKYRSNVTFIMSTLTFLIVSKVGERFGVKFGENCGENFGVTVVKTVTKLRVQFERIF
jgi:hypothetical protein